MIAEIFTKGLSAVQFTKLRKMLGVSYKWTYSYTSEEECWKYTLVKFI
jgi:hypothetical protein